MNRLKGLIFIIQIWILIFEQEVNCIGHDRPRKRHRPIATPAEGDFKKVPEFKKFMNNDESRPSDFDSGDIYQTLDFQAEWMPRKFFWESKNFSFEDRYKKEQTCVRNSSCHPPPLEAFVIPFSHNDPFWLQTFEGYFEQTTQFILNNVVEKLSQYEDMTFVWSEICFLAKWWDEVANSTQKAMLIKLVNEGRFEILTGAFIMADEASPSLFALSQQLIEGREWLRNNLNNKPSTAWSIDPFGYGSVMPYLLKGAGIKGMMIQRVHYAWKHWLAEHKYGDFLWNQRWDERGENKIHCLNAPYDLYPIQSSCGPTMDICWKFNFYQNRGYQEHGRSVTPKNIKKLADDLIGQFRRTASLTRRHNVVFATLGNDFTFSDLEEWQHQYHGYKSLFQFINNHPERYNAKVGFGTLSQYFEAVEKKHVALPNFKGDFFPYSDIYFAFPPAYWTGFYSTRPFWKRLSRKTEDELRRAEVLFTYTFNHIKQRETGNTITMKDLQHLSETFPSLVQARQLLALFQHHDGISGTSPRGTMIDMMKKLNAALQFSEQVQTVCVKILIRSGLLKPSVKNMDGTFLNLGDPEREHQKPLILMEDGMTVKKLVLFNSLGWGKSHLVRVLVDSNSTNLMVFSPAQKRKTVKSQINPYFKTGEDGKSEIFSGYHELVFIAYLEPFAIATYEIEKVTSNSSRHAPYTSAVRGTVKCHNCHHKGVDSFNSLNVTLENKQLKVTFSGESGLLKGILRKVDNISAIINMTYGKYLPEYGSGAYLSRPNTHDPIEILPNQTDKKTFKAFVVSGPVLHEVRIISEGFMISYRILREGTPEAQSVLHLTDWIQHSRWASLSDGEYFMRFQTDWETRAKSAYSSTEEPTFFTDTGLGVEKRLKVSRLPYQGNLYPVINYAWIQDSTTGKRLSILVDRSHGFTSTMSGHLEAIIDRKVSFDDSRGMSEGVDDPEVMASNYIILLESLPLIQQKNTDVWKPSLAVQRASKFLNYGSSLFVYDDRKGTQNARVSLFSQEFPEDVFLLNFRTTSTVGSGPGNSSLLLLQNLGHLGQNRTNSRQPLLRSDFDMDHYCIPTNLVGDPILGEDNPQNHFSTKTGKLNISKPFEVSAFAVYFEKSLTILIKNSRVHS